MDGTWGMVGGFSRTMGEHAALLSQGWPPPCSQGSSPQLCSLAGWEALRAAG